MDFGLLWFDDGKRPVQEKLRGAAEAYQARFRRKPDTVYVHTSDYAQLARELGQERPRRAAGLSVVACINILPCYFWIGRDEE